MARLADIIELASQLSGLPVATICGPKRHKPIKNVRACIIMVARSFKVGEGSQSYKHSYPKIARALGRDDHSTMIHACQSFDLYLRGNPALENMFIELHVQARTQKPFVAERTRLSELAQIKIEADRLALAIEKAETRAAMEDAERKADVMRSSHQRLLQERMKTARAMKGDTKAKNDFTPDSHADAGHVFHGTIAKDGNKFLAALREAQAA